MGNKMCNSSPVQQDVVQIPDQIHDKDEPSSNYARFENIKYQVPCTVNHVFTDIPQIQQDPSIERGKHIENSYFIIPYSVYYTGDWKKGKPHGIGTVVFANGTILKGVFVQGQVKGKDCILVIDDGSYYRGNIENNALSGQGIFVQQNGHTYDGQWDHNVPHGHGIQKFANGDIYQGQFVDGKKKGNNGRYKWSNHPNFSQYRGSFQNDYMFGQGELVKNNGQIISGVFRQNFIDDAILKGKQFQYNGQIKDGKFNGTGRMVNIPLNTIYEGKFVDGQPHGQGTITLPDGRKKQGTWFKGRLIKDYKNLNDKQLEFFITIIEQQLQMKLYSQDVVQSINYRLKAAQFDFKAELVQSSQSPAGVNLKYLVMGLGDKNMVIRQSK